jgi:SWI/SNF-related matrix-associated actin-dependent regulator 1 of chromatin subfamily A
MKNNLKLFPHQEQALKWIEQNKNSKVILALDMGLGKSAISAKTILPTEKVLVICPASLKINWYREVQTWANTPKITIVNKKSETLPTGAGTVIINYDILGFNEKQGKRKMAKPNFDFKDFDRVIVDESHMIKNPKAVRTKIAGRIISKAPKAILLSGTLMERAIDLYVPLTAIGANQYKYDAYGFKFCEPKLIDIGRRQVWSYRGLSNADELKHMMAPQTLVMKKEDVIDLPEKFIKVVALDLPVHKREKSYDLESIKKDPRPLGFEGLAELLHEQGLSKVKMATEHIKMRLEETEKIFITAKHSLVIDELKENLAEFNPVVLDGRCSLKQKQDAVDKFQNTKECRIFIGQNTAADKGITLTAANHVIMVEPDWSYSTLMQLIDRCHRIGQKNFVTAEMLVIANSIDERVLHTTLTKEGYIDALGL